MNLAITQYEYSDGIKRWNAGSMKAAPLPENTEYWPVTGAERRIDGAGLFHVGFYHR